MSRATVLTPRIRRQIMTAAKIEVDTITEVQQYASASTVRPRGSVKIQTVNRIMKGGRADSLSDTELVKIAEALRVVRVSGGEVKMAAPLSANLVGTSIASRMLTGPCHMLFGGDSISQHENPNRLPSALLRVFNGPTLRGIFAGGPIQANAGAGYQVVPRTVANVTQTDVAPWEDGTYPDTKNLLPCGRHELVFGASGATDDDLYRFNANDNLKSGGDYEYENFGDWIEDQTMRHRLIYATHTDGVDSLAHQIFKNEAGEGFTTTDANDTTFDSNGAVALSKSDLDLIATTTDDWTVYGGQVFTPGSSPTEGDGVVVYGNYLYVPGASDGIHIGTLARSGARAAQFDAAMNTAAMALFCEWYKLDTVFLTLGVNNMTDGTSKAAYKASIESIIAKFKAANTTAIAQDSTILPIKICLVAMYEAQAAHREIAADYADALFEISQADPTNVAFINLYRGAGPWQSLDDDSYLGGGTDVHPTEAGSLYFAGLLKTEINNA